MPVHLNLIHSNNGLGPEAGLAIAESLKDKTNLKGLDIGCVGGASRPYNLGTCLQVRSRMLLARYMHVFVGIKRERDRFRDWSERGSKHPREGGREG